MELLSLIWSLIRLVVAIQIREWADALETTAGKCRTTVPGLPLSYRHPGLRCRLILAVDDVRRRWDVEPMAPKRNVTTVKSPCGCKEVD